MKTRSWKLAGEERLGVRRHVAAFPGATCPVGTKLRTRPRTPKGGTIFFSFRRLPSAFR